MLIPVLLAASALAVDLDPGAFQSVTFDKIPQTTYVKSGDALKIVVEKSSSFLILPFSTPREVSTVVFEWQGEGELAMPDAATEKTKAGDDGRLKIGLMVSGEAPMIPFFAPGWVKAVRDHMKLPADRLEVLIVGAKTKAGESWESPYDDSITLHSVGEGQEKGGWRRVEAKLPKPLPVVGLWIMADGDNTGSSFTTRLRDLTLR